MLKLGRRSLAEWPARCRQQNPAHADLTQAAGKITGHALEDGVVLAVQRQQHRAALAHRLHKECAGHDQGFFIGQQDFLASINRRQGRAQTCCAHNRRHHGIHVRIGRDLAQSCLADQYLSGQPGSPQIVLQTASRSRLWHHGKARRVTHAQGQQLAQTREASQGENLIAIGVTRNDVQGTEPDRTGCAQHRNLLQAAHEAIIHNSTAKIGSAAVRLSIRSSTPP